MALGRQSARIGQASEDRRFQEGKGPGATLRSLNPGPEHLSSLWEWDPGHKLTGSSVLFRLGAQGRNKRDDGPLGSEHPTCSSYGLERVQQVGGPEAQHPAQEGQSFQGEERMSP